MKAKIIKRDPASAKENMQQDIALLNNLKNEKGPILHLYDFSSNAATYGYFTNPYAHLSAAGIAKKKLELAKRPTGGGIIFHLFDFTFSILLPETHPAISSNTLQNYATINSWVLKIIDRYFEKKAALKQSPTKNTPFCMTRPTEYDLIIEEKKIYGSAQRRTKYGLLHQASLSLLPPSKEFLNDLLSKNTLLEMEKISYPLLQDPAKLKETKQELKHLFSKEFYNCF